MIQFAWLTSSSFRNGGSLRLACVPAVVERPSPSAHGRSASQRTSWLPPLTKWVCSAPIGGMPAQKISVFLADDNLIVREGVRALIGTAADMEVVGVASDYDELVAGAERAAPQVVVTDIRIRPTFQREGIQAAKQVRKCHPDTSEELFSHHDRPLIRRALVW